MADDGKVKIACTHCKASFLVPGPVEGKKFRCPKCKEIFAAEGPSKATRTGRSGPSTRSVPKLVDDEAPAGERLPTRRELAQKKREEEAAAHKKRMKVVVPIVAAVLLLAGGAGGFFWWKNAQAEEAAHQAKLKKQADDDKVEKALAKARSLIQAGSNSEAAAALADAIASGSSFRWEAQAVRGRAKVGMKDFAGALADIDAALAGLPGLQSGWEPHYYRAAALLATRREEEALAAIRAASRGKDAPTVAHDLAGALSDFAAAKQKLFSELEGKAASLPEAPPGLRALDLGAVDLVLLPDSWDRPGWRLAGSLDAAALVKEYRPDDFPIPLLALREDTPFGAAVPTLRKLAEKGYKQVALVAQSGGSLCFAQAGLSSAEAAGAKVEVVEKEGKAAVAVGGASPEAIGDSLSGKLSGDVALSIGAFVKPSEAMAVLAACARAKGKPTILLDAARQDEGALAAALLWLARHQEDDGHWGADSFPQRCQGEQCRGTGSAENDAGVTGLAALAFLSAGVGPSDQRWPGFSRAVGSALDWIAKRQEGDGALVPSGTPKRVFQHAVGALALIQAVRLGGGTWKEPAQKAVAWLDASIGPAGWGYEAGEKGGDTTVTGWAVVTIAAARAAGLSGGDATLDTAVAWMDAATDDREFEVGYRPKQGKNRYAGRSGFPTMAGHALVVRVLVAGDQTSPKATGYASLLAKALPMGNDKGTWDFYYWHVGTPAMWLLDGPSGGPYWKAWSKALGGAVAPSQVSGEECSAGSWLDEDPWSKMAGRVYGAAINAMTLSVLTGRDTVYRGLKVGK
ncbi:MAG: hypothetical protein AAB434_05130 [Planctomycetota bacterium]|mgnify:CR=1 FL=1